MDHIYYVYVLFRPWMERRSMLAKEKASVGCFTNSLKKFNSTKKGRSVRSAAAKKGWTLERRIKMSITMKTRGKLTAHQLD